MDRNKICSLCGEPASKCECGHCDVCRKPYDPGNSMDHCVECGNCLRHCTCRTSNSSRRAAADAKRTPRQQF